MSPTNGALTADADRLYVSDPAAGHVIPIAIGIRQMASPIHVGQEPRICRLTPGDDILLVADSASNDLAVVRTKTLSLITLIPTGSRPQDVAIKVF
jgi:YVTN family beta-propeller protein